MIEKEKAKKIATDVGELVKFTGEGIYTIAEKYEISAEIVCRAYTEMYANIVLQMRADGWNV